MNPDELMRALNAERHINLWWRTPVPQAGGEDTELAQARRRRDLDAAMSEQRRSAA